MNRFITSFKALLAASMKMYFRNKAAVFFSLIVPLALLAVFGFLSKSGGSPIKVDLTSHANTPLGHGFVDAVKQVPALQVKEVSEDQAVTDLGKGDVDLQIIVPENFGAVDSQTGQVTPSSIITHYNQSRPQNGQVANLIVSQVVAGINAQASHAPQVLQVAASGVQTNNLSFFDFVLPGILAMIIMQSGLFGVAFAFVSFKTTGSLRRVQATPIHPRNFVFAQAITRLIMTLLTVAILIGFGMKFFGFHMIGSWFDFILLTVIGSLIFLGFGFAIAGYAKDENAVAPLANVIQLPMLLLSGIFFPRDAFPGWLKRVTDFFPLTYLTDGFRHVANEGLHLTQIWGDLLGLVIWCVLVFVLAISVFRWE